MAYHFFHFRGDVEVGEVGERILMIGSNFLARLSTLFGWSADDSFSSSDGPLVIGFCCLGEGTISGREGREKGKGGGEKDTCRAVNLQHIHAYTVNY